MPAEIVGLAILAVVLLFLLFFAALADSALRAINQVRLRSLIDQGVRRADLINRLLDQPHRIVATTLIINTFALTALAAISAIVALDVAPAAGWRKSVTIIVILLVAFLVIVFCQIIPRALAIRDPESIAIRITRSLTTIYIFVSPIAWLAEYIANSVIGLFGVRNTPRSPFVTEDDLRMLVNLGEKEGVIEQNEREMIAGILQFGDTFVHEVMVPRPDIVAIPETLSILEALETALQVGHSRLPIFQDSIDTIVGVLYTKDMTRAVLNHQENLPLKQIARPAVFIPETKKLHELLQELQTSKVHIAFVIDEYGGTAGLVTIEDLLEEIVGEIQDEYDVELPDIEQIGPDEWIARGGVALNDVNEQLLLTLNSEDYDTLGGYITAQLERLPVAGDEIDAEGVRMRVLETERRRIRRVSLKRLPRPQADDEETNTDTAGR